MLLSHVEPGNEVILKDIRGGRRLRSRLFSMGLLPGTRLHVLNPGGHGPVMLRVRDCNLAVCRGMAEKITVE
ncbi:MAG: ferrous iron transport protein A [Deltaproteobacteria bacterium]|nr:ferrous iron transport protein A [Deltaproteobacteria bacterium]